MKALKNPSKKTHAIYLYPAFKGSIHSSCEKPLDAFVAIGQAKLSMTKLLIWSFFFLMHTFDMVSGVIISFTLTRDEYDVYVMSCLFVGRKHAYIWLCHGSPRVRLGRPNLTTCFSRSVSWALYSSCPCMLGVKNLMRNQAASSLVSGQKSIVLGSNILLMEEILHHLRCIKPCKQWWILHINCCSPDFFHQHMASSCFDVSHHLLVRAQDGFMRLAATGWEFSHGKLGASSPLPTRSTENLNGII